MVINKYKDVQKKMCKVCYGYWIDLGCCITSAILLIIWKGWP